MNRRLLAVFAFALVVAGLASFAVYRLLISQVRTAPAAAPAASNKLVVAAHDLQVGALIHDSDLREISWSGAIPEHTLSKGQDVIGRGVVSPIYEGEPISEMPGSPKGAGAGLAATIPVGMRAVALRVNEVVGMAGFVLPGMRVDVLISGSPLVPNSAQTGILCRTVCRILKSYPPARRSKKCRRQARIGPGSRISW